jgi:hypothetical protein
MVAMIFPSAVSLYTHHTLGNVKWQGVPRFLPRHRRAVRLVQ